MKRFYATAAPWELGVSISAAREPDRGLPTAQKPVLVSGTQKATLFDSTSAALLSEDPGPPPYETELPARFETCAGRDAVAPALRRRQRRGAIPFLQCCHANAVRARGLAARHSRRTRRRCYCILSCCRETRVGRTAMFVGLCYKIRASRWLAREHSCHGRCGRPGEENSI